MSDRPTPGHGQNDLGYERLGPVARVRDVTANDEEECATCHGEGRIEVPGYSVNPFSGVLVADPQEAHDAPCPGCEEDQ